MFCCSFKTCQNCLEIFFNSFTRSLTVSRYYERMPFLYWGIKSSSSVRFYFLFISCNIVGDKLLLNLVTKFHMRNYKIVMATFRTSQGQDGVKNIMNKDFRTLKDAWENINTRQSTSRRILSGILSKTRSER